MIIQNIVIFIWLTLRMNYILNSKYIKLWYIYIITDFVKQHGIICQITTPYSPQCNGVAKRKNKTLLDVRHGFGCPSGYIY